MKKKEQVEVQYVKMNTAITIAIVCLVVGFLAGTIYSTYKGGQSMPPPQATVAPGAPSNLEMNNRIMALEKDVAANPKNANAWVELGNLYFDTNNYQDSIRSYRKYIELIPDNPNVWTDLGVMYRRSGQPEEALSCFDKAIEINPKHEQSRYNKGIVLMQDLQNSEAAILAWQELIKINPNFKTPNGQSVKDMLEKL